MSNMRLYWIIRHAKRRKKQMAKEQALIRVWRVTDTLGEVHSVKAHFMFQPEDGSLSFRYKTDTQSYVPAAFGTKQWVSCILLDPPAEEPLKAPTGASPPKQAPVTPFPKRGPHRQLDDEIPF
jgi:hypothetical protein